MKLEDLFDENKKHIVQEGPLDAIKSGVQSVKDFGRKIGTAASAAFGDENALNKSREEKKYSTYMKVIQDDMKQQNINQFTTRQFFSMLKSLDLDAPAILNTYISAFGNDKIGNDVVKKMIRSAVPKLPDISSGNTDVTDQELFGDNAKPTPQAPAQTTAPSAEAPKSAETPKTTEEPKAAETSKEPAKAASNNNVKLPVGIDQQDVMSGLGNLGYKKDQIVNMVKNANMDEIKNAKNIGDVIKAVLKNPQQKVAA